MPNDHIQPGPSPMPSPEPECSGRSQHPATTTTASSSPCKDHHHDEYSKTHQWTRECRRRILAFTPSWFSVNMGTGIVSILLYNLPYQFRGLKIIADIVFVLNVVLFFIFLAMSLLRYTLWPSVFLKMLWHPQQSLFLGTFPMGFATIVNMVVYACVPTFGKGWATFAWVLWWIDIVVALVIAIGMPFVVFTRHQQEVNKVSGVWLLPSVATIVASATGAIVAEHLEPRHAKLTLTICYMLLGTGLLPAFMIMALYFQRLSMHKLVPGPLIVSTFLPLGPCGQGGFALMQISKVLRQICHASNGTALYTAAEVRLFGDAIYACTIPTAMVIWGFGFFWLCHAVASIIYLLFKGEKLKFNIGWWGLTFPLGVFATCTTQFWRELDSGAFRVLGTILSLCVVLLWLFVGILTLWQAWTGAIFVAPCLGEAEMASLLPKKQDDGPKAACSNGGVS